MRDFSQFKTFGNRVIVLEKARHLSSGMVGLSLGYGC